MKDTFVEYRIIELLQVIEVPSSSRRNYIEKYTSARGLLKKAGMTRILTSRCNNHEGPLNSEYASRLVNFGKIEIAYSKKQYKGMNCLILNLTREIRGLE